MDKLRITVVSIVVSRIRISREEATLARLRRWVERRPTLGCLPIGKVAASILDNTDLSPELKPGELAHLATCRHCQLGKSLLQTTIH